MPSAGASSTPAARTASNSRASSPGRPAAAIQFADSFTSESFAIGAHVMLVIASAIARRAEAAASSSATGARSPIAIASPVLTSKLVARHGRVGDRHLPGPDHLIARGQAADGAIADGDEERLVGDGRQAKHAASRLRQVNRLGRERRAPAPRRASPRASCAAACRAARRSADRSGLSPSRLSSTSRRRRRWRGRRPRADSARAPPAPRTSPDGRARSPARSVPAPRCTRAPAATARARRWGCRAARRARRGRCRAPAREARSKAARADVVDRHDRVAGAQRHAAVDHLLAAALHLGVVALHGREIQIPVRRSGRQRRRRAAAQADQHRRTAQHDERRARAGSRAFFTCSGRTLPKPPATMIGLW